jgi:hypothetical protein
MLLIPMKMRAVDLSITMAEMRAWLDTHKCEPKNFTHARQGNIVSVVSISLTRLRLRRSRRASVASRQPVIQ